MFLPIYKEWFFVFLFIFNIVYVLPTTANASIISAISNFFSGSSQTTDDQIAADSNSQNVSLLTSTANFDAIAAVGGGDITIADNEALVSESGPSGTLADIGDTVNTGQISRYTVRKGDTLSSIAKMYGVSVNTIIWANNVTANSLKDGQSLVILPVSGTLHTVVKGDTLQSIAKKYKADVGEIAQFNGLDSSASLNIGDTIVIPDGEGSTPVSGTGVSAIAKGGSHYNPYRGGSGPDYSGYYTRPLNGGVKTQGLHGYNAIDIGTPVGTPIYAAAAGQVIIARSSGWNGGYGKYIVISHYNGTQTLYDHLSEVLVGEGQTVAQGETIALSGNTGDVLPAPTPSHPNAGAHLHFEVRGAYNFMADPAEY